MDQTQKKIARNGSVKIANNKIMKLLTTLFVTLFCLSQVIFAQAPDSEIYLFSIQKEGGKYLFSNGKNITNRKGYDNQPFFSKDSKTIYFTTNRTGNNFDIYKYSLTDNKTSPVVTSEANEYSAKDFDENTLHFVREGKNQLMTVFEFDKKTKKEKKAFKVNEPIAYYAFNKNKDALVWVRYAFFMNFINTEKSINRFVANYAQPSVPHLIPNTNKFSFVQRHPDDSLWIKEFNPENQAIRPIITSKDGKRDYCWMQDGSLLMASGTELYRFDEKKDKTWVLIANLQSFGIKSITRMVVSPDGNYLAVVDNK